MIAQVRNHHEAPTLFLNGKPVFYSLMWGSAPAPDAYILKECARLYGEAGIHFFTFDIGAQGSSPEWCGPREGQAGHYDFSTLAQRFEHVIQADPQAHFHLRVHLEAPEWWQQLYPEECELLSDGRRMCQSFASQLWREQAKDFLRALVDHIEQAGLGERVVAYQCGAGATGEWVKGPGAMGLTCGDYSQPMQDHFRSWLHRQYPDEKALRTAWIDPEVTFANARVPSPDAQLQTTRYTFRDPRKEAQAIDYYRCLAETCGELVVDFCAAIKEATHGKALAGAFYGYLTELAWNAGFFGEGADSEYSTYQRSGHLGLRIVLESPQVDFLVSPYSYGLRGIGGDGPAMPPSESMRIHNKLYILEDDTRTHLSCHDHPNFGKTDTLEENLAVLQRNLAYAVTHGDGIWWLGGGGPQSPHVDLSQQPAFRPWIRRFQEIGTFALNLERAPNAEVAVLLDDDSFFYEGLKNYLDIPLIFQQRLWGLAHMGAPFDVYLLDDFLSGRTKSYKLYVFLNAFHLDRTRRETLKRLLRKDGQVALWIYAPGYIDQEGSTRNMGDLTGINLAEGEHPWGPFIYLVDLSHPITQHLSQDVTWGTNSLLGPNFHVDDPDARVLGNVVYSQGRCRPGFVVKEFQDWKSVYSAAPGLPAPVLRGIARYAGVHIYNDKGDVIYATPQLLAVHTAAGGERDFCLPQPVTVIYDMMKKRMLAEHTDRFQVNLPPASTVLYYMGDTELLDRYNQAEQS
ncbi:MAG: beta-galactosidase [Omnitrophica WOR_2 bacterium]